MRIEFARPYLLILIPFIIAGLFLSMRFLRTVDKKRRLKQTIVRSLLFSFLILAMSGVSILSDNEKTATVFVVDVSDTLKNNADEISGFINSAISEKSKNDYVGVVAFGRNAAIENVLSTETVFTGILSEVDSSATNIEDAVMLALSSIPEGYAKRIVIISDGDENLGCLEDTAASLALSECSLLTWIPETAQLGDEVYISNLTVPESCGVNEDFSIKVEIKSNVSTNAVVSLYLGRELRGRQDVALLPGPNYLTFKDTQSETGLKSYQVTIEPEKDTYFINNEYSAYTNISRKNPLLIVEGKPGYGDSFCELLDNIKRAYVRVTPEYIPNTLSELLNYDAVVFINVSAMGLNTGFLENIEAYVSDYGKGFVVCGGKQSFALGGYKDTVLEDILPVYMDVQGEKEIPKMAIQLVIDKSGSMSGRNLEQAKQAALAAVQTMRDTDYIGVMSFDDTFSRVVPLTTLEDRNSVNTAINSIQIEGGTSIFPALQAAIKDLSKNDASIKHIILLTDGQDSFEIPHYSGILHEANDQSITVSTVAIGVGCNAQLLQHIADSCNGRMYEANDQTDVPMIFTQEVYLSANSYIVDEEFTPVVNTNGGRSNDILGDVAESGLPSLKGYIATTLKEVNAIEVISSFKEDPILAYRQLGLGRTVAWTSDVTAEWSGNFFGWSSGNSSLWNNILSFITHDVRVEGSYAEVETTTEGARIIYHAGDEFSANTTVTATVFDSGGNSFVLSLPATSPGIFEASFDMSLPGVYSIALSQYEGEELIGGLNTAAIKKYSLEYAFDFNRNKGEALLDKYTAKVGGSLIESPSEVFSSRLDSVKGMTDITTPILIIALLFFIFDIAYRRFNFHLTEKLVKAFAKLKKPARTSNAAVANVSSTGNTTRGVQTSSEVNAASNGSTTSGSNVISNGNTLSEGSAASAPETAANSQTRPAASAKKVTKKAPLKEPETLDPSQLLNRLKK